MWFTFLAAAWMDVRKRIISNRLFILAFGIRCFLWFMEIAGEQKMSEEMMRKEVLEAGLVFGILVFLSVLGKGAIGMGDVKLLTILALYRGYDTVYAVFVSGISLAAVVSLYWLLAGKKQRSDRFPFAPFLLAGYLLVEVMKVSI